MENINETITVCINNLKDIVDEVGVTFEGESISKVIFDGYNNFHEHYANLKNQEGMSVQEFLNLAKNVTVYAILLGQNLSAIKSNEIAHRLGKKLISAGKHCQEYLENATLKSGMYKISPVSTEKLETVNVEESAKHAKLLSKELESTMSALNQTDKKIAALSSKVEVIEQNVKNELQKVASLYEEQVEVLESKEEQINEILGHVSGRAIAGDYEKSAESEIKMADWLRYASLSLMGLIVLIVGYSFWETTLNNFEWQNALFRISLAFILSVPAAYLANESAKHRSQHYAHLQTSLDLKAITPYIASLPDEEQHKIKVEIANKLFANKVGKNSLETSVPVGSHEIILELLKKIEFKK